ncbi:MAG: glucosaminidase domain-containing protein [Saprospiraceae bacterium]|nr:glucosaminidase domain-containing protein [Saprospiraceae bacterium]
MRPETYTNYEVRQKDKEHDMFSRQKKAVKASNGGQEFIGIDLNAILQHLWKGLGKLYVALKYQVSKRPGIEKTKFKMPWLKLGLAALALFILTQKDIHFSINMKAPLETMVDDRQESPNTPSNVDQMSIVSPVSLTTKAVEPRFSLSNISDKQAKSYIKRFEKVARAEMDKFGIPASIKMAQGILESRAGTNEGAMTYNNHFGQVMSGSEYTSAWQNWRAHSIYLQENYPSLFELGANRKKWAKEFKQLGYSGDKYYGQYLLEIIKKYDLDELD